MNPDSFFKVFTLLIQWMPPLISIGAGIFFFLMWRRKRDLAMATLRWPSVTGRIVSATVSENEGSRGKMFRPSVEYDYEVDGIRRSGTRIALDDVSCSDPRWSEKTLANYPAGRSLPVYYDPAAPDSSLLRPGMTVLGRIPLIAAIGLFLSSIVWVIVTRHFMERFERFPVLEKVEQPRSP